MPGDIVFAAGALLMAWDFLVKLRPLVSRAAVPPKPISSLTEPGEEMP